MSHTKWLCYSSSSISKSLSLGAPLYLLISHPYTNRSLKFTKLEPYGCPVSLFLPFSRIDRTTPQSFLFVLMELLWWSFPSLELCSQADVSSKKKKIETPKQTSYNISILVPATAQELGLTQHGRILPYRASLNPFEELRLCPLACYG